MAIVKMKKTTIIALRSEKESIVERLQSFGGLHISSLEEDISGALAAALAVNTDGDKGYQLEAKLSQIKYCLEFFRKYDKSKKGLFPAKTPVTEPEYRAYLERSGEADAIVESCKAIDGKLAEAKARESKIQNAMQLLEPWLGMDIPVEDIRSTRSVHIAAGSVPSKHAAAFLDALAQADGDIHAETISVGKENAYLLIAYHKESEESAGPLLKQYGWAKATFSDAAGTPQQQFSRLQKELEDIGYTRDELFRQAEQLAVKRTYFETLSDIFSIEKDKQDVDKYFGETQKAMVISGWIPAKNAGQLEKALSSVTDSFHITFEDPGEDEDFPVLLDNPPLARPMEFITEQYSTPSAKGIDPSAIMGFFFIMFFGMMVSDAVYGIILFAATYIMVKKFKPEGNFKKMLNLLCLGGLSTFFWGAAFGGWMGDMIKVPAFLFNPLEKPFNMIFLCLGMGIIHLFVGMGMQAYRNIKAGNILDAVYDQGLWYAVLIGLLLLLAPGFGTIGKYMAVGGAAGLVLTQGRAHKNPVRRLLSGILSLYSITGFLGDVLSYLRLFALGLATGIIATVINSMLGMMTGSVIGVILMIVIAVIGHGFNLAINTLGAYVHSSRLQYVEFFGKFFEGDGKPFVPFRFNTRYIRRESN